MHLNVTPSGRHDEESKLHIYVSERNAPVNTSTYELDCSKDELAESTDPQEPENIKLRDKSVGMLIKIIIRLLYLISQ